MHPAFSVLLFTTLSGAGYGLLLWAGGLILIPALQGRAPAHGAVVVLWGLLLALGLVLTTVGLISSMFHLGKPGRAWRAFSQWRTSWLSREGVFAVLTALAVLALLAMLGGALFGRIPASVWSAVPALAGLMVVLALCTIGSTAMIYASLKPIPAWRQGLVVPLYFAFAALSGWLVLMALANWAGLSDEALAVNLLVTFALTAVTAMLKLVYWHRIDRQPLGATRGDAVGLPGREVSVFERPHTQDNYLNREMGFVLARRHARPLRAISVLLFAAVPAVGAWLAWAQPDWAGPVFTVVALLALLGILVERWLFFAQARHMVTLYY